MPSVAFLNTNYREYSEGKVVVVGDTSYDLSWGPRSLRLGSLLKNDGKSSLIGLNECDSQMMEDLCAYYGSPWKCIGGENYFTSKYDGHAQDKNGFLYDSSKWDWNFLGNWKLPGGGTRNLLGVDWVYLPSGKKVRVYVTHLSSGAPVDRVLQMNACLEIMGDDECVFMADLNSQSTKEVAQLTALAQNPRVQLPLHGFVEAPYQTKPYPTYNGYGEGTSRLDYVGLSPAAVKAGRLKISSAEIIPALTPPSGPQSAYGTDHNLIRLGLGL
jgi:endonuclease/exonuclease/phosphatase family metal-dependent hydrolase